MTETDFSINPNFNKYRAPLVPHFVQEFNGLYIVKRPLKLEEVIELAKHVISSQFKRGVKLSNATICKDFFITTLSLNEDETFCAVFLDTDNRIIAYEILEKGSINYAQVSARRVIKSTLKHNAAKIILAHNHPSGIINYSNADIHLTQKLKTLLKEIDVELIDHIIVAGNQAKSFAEEGIIFNLEETIR